MMIVSAAMADSFYWIGVATTPEGDPDNSWSNPENWSLDGSTPGSDPVTDVPDSDDTAIFNPSAADIEITVDSARTVNALQITGSKKVTINTGSYLSITDALTIIVDASLSLPEGTDLEAGTIYNSGTLTFNGGTLTASTLTNPGTFTCSGNTIINSAYSGGGTFNASPATTSFYKNADFSSGTFKHRNGTVIFAGTATAQELSAKSDGTTTFNEIKIDNSNAAFTVNQGIKATAFTVTAANTVTFSGSNTITHLTVTSASSLDFSAGNTFTNFTAENLGGCSFTFAAGETQKVTGSLTLSGTSSTGTLLHLSSSSSTDQWHLQCSTASISYVDIINCKGSSLLTATNSDDLGNNEKFNFPGESYEWQGGGTDWETASCWEPPSVPGKGAVVTIPDGLNDDEYPVLTKALNISYSNETPGSITVNGKFNLAGYNLTVDKITNNGLIILKGNESISGTMSNGTGSASTIEYTSTSTTAIENLPWDGDSADGKNYNHLILNRPVNTSNEVSVAGDLTIKNAVSFSGKFSQTSSAGTITILGGNNKTVSLSNENNTINGSVIIGDSSTTGGKVTLSGKTSDAANPAISLSSDIYAQSLTLNSGVQGSAFNFHTPLTLVNASVTTSGAQTYEGKITISGSATKLSASQIDFADDIDASENNFTIDASVLNSTKETQAEIKASTIEFAQDTELTATKGIKLSATELSQPSGSSFTITNSTELTLGTGISVNPTLKNNNKVTCNGAASFAENYSGTGSFTAVSGTITFNKSADFSGGYTHGSETVKFTGTSTSQSLTTSTSETAEFNKITIDNSNAAFTVNQGMKALDFTVTAADTVTFSGSNEFTSCTITSANTVTFSKSNEFTNFTLNASDCTLTFSKGNTFSNFTAQDLEGLIITFSENNIFTNFTAQNLEGSSIAFTGGALQEIKGVLKLSGKDNDNKLTITGPFILKCTKAGSTGATHSISFIDIKDCDNQSDYYLTALNSLDQGNNIRWHFPGMTYYWLGGGTDWETASYWNPPSVPGKGSNVVISVVADDRYPILTDTLDIANTSETPGIITVKGEFDLAGNTLKVDKIINDGLIKLKGSESISGTMSNGDGTTSTVWYYDTDTSLSSLVWDGDSATGKQYNNLIMDNPINTSNQVDIAADLTINNAASFSGKLSQTSSTGTITILAGTDTEGNGKTVILANTNNRIDGTVTIGNSTTTGGKVTLSGKTSDTGNPAVSLSPLVYAKNLILNNDVQGKEATLTFHTPLTLVNASVTTSGTQTYDGKISITGSGTKLSASQIDFADNIDATGKSFTINTDSLNSTKASEAEIAAVTLEFAKSLTITATNGILLSVTNVSQSTGVSAAVTNEAELTLEAAITVTPELINNNKVTCNGTASFAENYSGSGAFIASSDITSFKKNLDFSSGSYTHGSGTINFAGDGTAQTLSTRASTDFWKVSVTSPAKVETATSFIVSGPTWTNTTTEDGFTASSPSEISFTNSSVSISGKNTFNKVIFPTDNQEVLIASAKANSFAQVEINGSGSNFTAENTGNSFTDYIKIGDSTASPSPIKAGTIKIKGTGAITISENACCEKLTIIGIGDAATSILTFNGDCSTDELTLTSTSNIMFKGDCNAGLLSASSTAENSEIDFKGQIVTSTSAAGEYSASVTAKTTITSASSASPAQISGKKLKITGNYQNNGNVNFAMPVVVTGTTLNSSGAVLNTSASIVFTSTENFTNEGSVTPGTDSEFHLKANLTDTGSWAESGKIIFNGTTAQTFSPKAGTNYLYVEIAKNAGNFSAIDNTLSTQNFYITLAKNCTFTQNCILGTITLTKADNTKFEGTAEIDSFINTEEESGTITFTQDTLIKDNTDFKTKSLVTIGDEETDTFDSGISSARKNLTHTAGQTIVYGTINGADLTFGPLETKGEVTVNADNVILKQNLTSDAKITFNSNLIADGNGGQNSDKSTTINNAALLKIADGYALKYTGTLKQSGTGKLELGGSLIGDGAASGDATFATDLLFNGDSTRTISAYGTKKISTAGDIIIDVSPSVNPPATVTVNSGTAASGTGLYSTNLVIYSGNIILYGKAASKDEAGDLILLGSAYSIEDTYSGATEAYKYNQAAGQRLVNTNYTITRDAPYNAVLTVNGGAVLHAGQNFYANGLHITGNAAWTLETRKNSDGAVSFAEAYNFSVSNSTVKCWEDNTSNGSSARVAADGNLTGTFGDKGNNNNWEFEAFKILNVYTVRDNALCVEFNSPLRNLHGEINGNAKDGVTAVDAGFKRMPNFTYSAASYSDIYSDPDCQNRIKGDFDTETSAGSGIYRIYLKAPQTWNTDATGTSAGLSDKSTDRNGDNKNSIPYLNVPRSLSTLSYIITNKWGKRLNHYSGTNRITTDVLDKTGPVLVQVRTGQEMHENVLANQAAYDSHNFIEFIYSEAVNFGDTTNATVAAKKNTADWIPAYESGISGTENRPQNIKVSSALGYTEASALNFRGLKQTIAAGQIHTKELGTGTDSQDVNALYRESPYSIKYSLAGYASNVSTDGTISGSYITWPGYIEEAVTPSGSVTGAASSANPNALVTDCATDKDGNAVYNRQIMNKPELAVNNNTEAGTNYGPWDTQAPVFVKGHLKGNENEESYFEAIGNGNGSTLTKIEIHIADNPSGTDSFNKIWLTRFGWADTTSPTSSLSSAADNLVGGSRPYAASNKTSGGLRYCTIVDQENAFKYEIGDSNSTTKNFLSIAPGAAAPFFTSSTSDRHDIPMTQDNTYINLELTDTSLQYKTTFTVSYDSSNSYITDLAGNRLKSQSLMKTIDRTSPDFKISFTPVNSNKLLLIFVKGLTTQIKYNQTEIPESFETIIPYCFELGTISDSTYKFTANSAADELQIDTSTPAKILKEKSNNYFTVVELSLNRKTKLEDIKTLYIRLKAAGTVGSNTYNLTSNDPLTGNTDSYVTFIQDSIGNYMQMYQAHALSDFAAEIVNPLYAYNDDLDYEGENITQNLYEDDSWAVHDWDEEQKNYGTLLANKPVTLISSVDEKSLTADSSGNPEFTLKLYYSVSPTKGSQSKNFNDDIPENQLRLWMPSISGFKDNGTFPAYSDTVNTKYGIITGSLVKAQKLSEGLTFKFDKSITKDFKSGSQVSFLFGLCDTSGTLESLCITPTLSFTEGNASYTISDRVPLFCIRLKDKSDITSLDLWSFKLKDITNQRGGVTILNNVINATKGEKSVIKIDLPSEGRLSVMVMTLDGNIVAYLNRGNTKAGEHYFTWDGKNKNGAPVARGMYFVRVTGSGIDETRKIMVVKD